MYPVEAEGWYKDPYRLHTDRWYSNGKPTALVRDKGVESHDDPPPGEPLQPTEHAGECSAPHPDELRRADDAEPEVVEKSLLDLNAELGPLA